jgi:hypothetical protein
MNDGFLVFEVAVMSHLSLEQRVATLEQQVAEIRSRQTCEGDNRDWRRTVGMFTDNPGMQELFAEALKIREADRKKARRPQRRGRRVKS